MVEKIGVIGLGVMGRPIAQNLMEAGYELVLYNRTPEKAEEIAGDEATVAGSSREVAEQSDIIITMLPAAPEVREVVAGEDGVLEGIKEGALLVDMSTISSTATEELGAQIKERGASMLDAPVPGGDPGEQGGTLQRAQEGTLQIMVGGSEEDFERAKPLFDVLGENIAHVGPLGAGQIKMLRFQT
jgi:2-hydroxy-3-oxopropionate reductase